MKIKTITCQHVYNYGASLQAYALQHYLETLGNDVEIIDFNPWFHCNRYNPFWVPRIGRIAKIIKTVPITKYLLLPIKAYRDGMFKTWGRKRRFDEFERIYYNLTPIKYYSSAQLADNAPEADVYIAGSDQIWNTFCENGNEPGYYLKFGNKSIKRLSYAASLATSTIKEESRGFVKDSLSKFQALSVREDTGAQLLKELGFENISVVLDPVFLLKKNEWSKLSIRGNNHGLISQKYVLVYDFLGDDAQMISFIKDYAQQKALKIVSITDSSIREYADISINDAGPLEFLALIENAQCVISSSFHATAFSVIFEKEFYTFNLKGHNNSSRMHDFLSSLGLLERLNPQKDSDTIIDWEIVGNKLDRQRIKSQEFLKENL